MIDDSMLFIDGGRHESMMENKYETINSKDIISLEYDHPEYFLKVEKIGKKLKVVARGGNNNQRDGTYFRIVLETEDFILLNELQKIIEKYEIAKNNGYCLFVDGLPGGLGDKIDVKYESGETIYKTSNQGMLLSEDAASALYNAFHQYVKKQGLDFNSEGSNVQLYDDADEEYLQGTWKGKHFGSEIEVTFEGKKVRISVNGQETDNEEYQILEGTVVSKKLKEGVTDAKNHHDYESFKGVSIFSKKNWFTITGYFLQDSYSTCDLMNFDKKIQKINHD